MDEKSTYYKEREIKLETKKNEVMELLPSFAKDYLIMKSKKSRTSTILGYARDLFTFFKFLQESNPEIAKKNIKDITLNDMAKITASDINEYTIYLGLDSRYTQYNNQKVTMARKFAPLNGLFNYNINQRFLKYNPIDATGLPHETEDKDRKRIDAEDVKDILDVVQYGSPKYKDKQSKFREKNRLRDYTIIKLLLNTGIRVSECVGLDISSINFRKKEMYLVRKGGGNDTLDISDDIAEMLLEYIREYRATICPKAGQEEALFYSLQGKRMSVSSIEKMIKGYGDLASIYITPHKCRGIYGTELYDKTGDIALVADVLGHKSIDTTRKKYVYMKREHKRRAAEIGPLF